MNCIIPCGNMKIISKTLHTLAKIGDHLYIEARPDYLQFATINLNKTSYVTFNFTNMFFSYYEINNDISEENAGNITCKVYMKAVLSIFKTKGPKDKNMESCKIELDKDATRLMFKLKYKYDITVVHSIKLIDMEFVSVSYDKTKMVNQFNGTGSFFAQVLTNFQTADDDMSLEIKNNKTYVRNYDIASSRIGKNIRSQVVLNASEFTFYDIKQESNITLCFKPFRAAVSIAETFNMQIIINFDTGGRPVILTINNSTFEVSFVLSTINPDGYTQSCTNSSFTLPNGPRSKPNNAEFSKEDQTMLEALNWDSDFEGDNNDISLPPSKSQINNILVNDGSEVNRNGAAAENVEEMIPESPESPRTKRLKIVFGRCFEATFDASKFDFGEELAPNSDPE